MEFNKWMQGRRYYSTKELELLYKQWKDEYGI